MLFNIFKSSKYSSLNLFCCFPKKKNKLLRSNIFLLEEGNQLALGAGGVGGVI